MEVHKLLQNKVVRNAGWIIGGKAAHLLLSFVVGLLVARYLGPSNYGLINYAAAYISFFSAICTLGINVIIVKEFVDHPEQAGETVGTTLLLRVLSSLLSALTILTIVRVMDGDEPVTVAVVGLCCVGMLFNIFDTLPYWFQARLQSKYPMIAATVSYLVVSGYKLYLLMTGKSVEWFAASASIDYIVAAVILLWVYHRHGGPRFSVSRKKAAQLLKSSSSFIVTGLMVSIYANTDKFMLKQMLDETAVGHYAMAVSLASVWGFLLTAVIDSMNPGIMQLRRTDVLAYERRNRQLYAIVFYIAVSASMVFSLGAHWIVKLLYGDAFLPAVRPLRIVVWYMAFSYLGVARNAWIVSENKQKYLQLLYPCAAVVNVALNLLLIPPLGASGAALASLATQISTTFIIPFFIRELRPNAMLMLQAVFLRGVLGKDARADES